MRPVTSTSSQIVICPAILTIPAIMQRLPMVVLPEMPVQPAMAVCADTYVVPDLDLAVELHALFDPRIFDGTPIDGGVGADLHIIANPHAPNLWDFQPAVRPDARAKAYAANPKPSAPITSGCTTTRAPRRTLRHRVTCATSRVCSPMLASHDDAARSNACARSDLHAGLHDGARLNTGAGRDLGARIHLRAGMNAGWRRRPGMQQCGNLRVASAQGLGLKSAATGHRSANFGSRMTAAACVAASCRRYLGLARKATACRWRCAKWRPTRPQGRGRP